MGGTCGRCLEFKAGSNRARKKSDRYMEAVVQAEAQNKFTTGEAGAVVTAMWQGEDHLATVCASRAGQYDLVWEEGQTSTDVSPKLIRRPLQGVIPARRWAPGERAEAWWQTDGTWGQCVVTAVEPGAMRAAIEWTDRTTTEGMPLCWLRPPADVHAEEIANPTKLRGKVRLSGALDCRIFAARGLPKTDRAITGTKIAGDPYCEVRDHHGRVLARTHVVPNSTAPEWNYHCVAPGLQGEDGWLHVPDTETLSFVLMDHDRADRDDLMGKAYLTWANGLDIVCRGGTFAGWLPLRGHNGEGDRGQVRVWLRLRHIVNQFTSLAVTGARYEPREGCRVTLFQSAHVGDHWRKTLTPVPVYTSHHTPVGGTSKTTHAAPAIPEGAKQWMRDDDAEGTRLYYRRDCWEEQFVAIMEARVFVYMCGWSVNTDVTMLREDLKVIPVGPPEDPGKYKRLLAEKGNLTIGEILKLKAQEGVKVCVLIWNEMLSIDGISAGVAATHSAQTQAYFQGTGVECRAHYREGTQLRMKLFVTHHQKGVCCDAAPLKGMPAGAERRRVLAFVGGIDVTKGRWDTPEKSIFRTLPGVHGRLGGPTQDFYSAILTDPRFHRRGRHHIPEGTAEGPRQPWQDIHCKLEGAAAIDVCDNFETRWKTQGADGDARYVANVATHPRLMHGDEDGVFLGEHPERWTVQFLRSIDSYSDSRVLGIEADIHKAWVQAIERSERFVYIENQYFLGSSNFWKKTDDDDDDDDHTSTNRIPIAIAERIERAIRKGERWCCYVVMPMYPEGDPQSSAMQEIVHWQYSTIEMMYDRIARHIKMYGKVAGDHPCNYLNFYCLGTREMSDEVADPLIGSDKSQRARVLRSARGPIYVHSKMLISDDEYVIVGSANINDRSMAGDRDTEQAVACWQPAHSREVGPPGARRTGAVSAFRKSLFTEHLNLTMQELPGWVLQPESLECVMTVNRKALLAWEEHASEGPKREQRCHLMKYPVKVNSKEGTVSPIQKSFPDHPKAHIRGENSILVPDFITS